MYKRTSQNIKYITNTGWLTLKLFIYKQFYLI